MIIEYTSVYDALDLFHSPIIWWVSWCIIFSQLTGSQASSYAELVRNIFRPLPILIMVISNLFLASAVYFGFLVTSTAIPIMLSIGIVTSLFYSLMFLGVTLTTTKITGIILIIVGIYFLK